MGHVLIVKNECRRWESNPHALKERGILSPLRLPFRHSGKLL